MDNLLMDLALGLILLLAVGKHLWRTGKKERAARISAQHAAVSEGPRAQHPHIDISWCIGCGACVTACPEYDVLAVLGGKAALVNPAKCIGHGLCADACPVGAIEIVMAAPSMTADLPALSEEQESSVPNLFIAGELSGLALIKNAVNQGRECIDVIASRVPALRRTRIGGVVDVCIVGAGPAGLSASLRAVERKLTYVTLESEDFGGTVARYPRQKLVMTSPVEFPMHGKFNKLAIGKEELLAFWQKAAKKAGLRINTQEPVEHIRLEPDGAFTIETGKGRYRALTVVLAIGRRGTPRKLDIPGEALPKVMYSLIDAEAYQDQRILVVGGGDSAVEAAMGLAHAGSNRVTLSYRKDVFSRLKERNDRQIREYMRKGRLQVIFNSQPLEIHPDSVVLQVAGGRREIPNDYVFVFAGGTPPNAFLEKVGVQLGSQDLTEAAVREAREVA
ncbi:MAG TPA: NAD(P)-binding domain-containing protein [Gemmatimonadales bacterium]|nr:NAD(P)-binding domain-containing protein [Gemmatimonadales bacterium]